MKKHFLITLLVLFAFSLNAQIFWTETFYNGCTTGCLASAYTGTNGAWTVTNLGVTTDACGTVEPNEWYISCAENGGNVGTCGTACINSPTLHVSNTASTASASSFCPAGDCGAAYDAGGYCSLLSMPPGAETDKRAESPVINCLGKSSITIAFSYIEYGQGAIDNATLWYYDGSAWSQLSDPPKTLCCGSVPCTGSLEGMWTAYSIALPTSADNNANIKIGFRWVNDDDGTGTDPSFAVENVTLSSVITGINASTNHLSNYIFSVSQNQGTGLLTITLNGSTINNNELKILNSLGQVIYNDVLNTNTKTIDVSAFSYGIYFVQMKTEKGIAVKKFIKF